MGRVSRVQPRKAASALMGSGRVVVCSDFLAIGAGGRGFSCSRVECQLVEHRSHASWSSPARSREPQGPAAWPAAGAPAAGTVCPLHPQAAPPPPCGPQAATASALQRLCSARMHMCDIADEWRSRPACHSHGAAGCGHRSPAPRRRAGPEGCLRLARPINGRAQPQPSPRGRSGPGILHAHLRRQGGAGPGAGTQRRPAPTSPPGPH